MEAHALTLRARHALGSLPATRTKFKPTPCFFSEISRHLSHGLVVGRVLPSHRRRAPRAGARGGLRARAARAARCGRAPNTRVCRTGLHPCNALPDHRPRTGPASRSRAGGVGPVAGHLARWRPHDGWRTRSRAIRDQPRRASRRSIAGWLAHVQCQILSTD